ncbi:phytoene desaturase family protein [Thermodesulfobacteriota bacterium]
MADATFDAVLIGGGTKGLITAMYLAKYGGMSVGIFERGHEAGGAWTTEECAVPGFLTECHASSTNRIYMVPVEKDFPDWEELGGMFNDLSVGQVALFEEDQSHILIYGANQDPSGERTAASIARHSEKDAEAWLTTIPKLREQLLPLYLKWLYTPATPPGETDALDKLFSDPASGFDPRWTTMSPYEVCSELFESDRLIAATLRRAMAMGFYPGIRGLVGPLAAFVAAGPVGGGGKWGTTGGTHQFAHAAAKILWDNGAKIFTKREVDKVIIENGKAMGIRLTDGTEIAARKLVLSGLDPRTLCFRLIGKEHISEDIRKKVGNLQTKHNFLTWYSFAVHESPDWKAAADNPDINKAQSALLISKDPKAMLKDQVLTEEGKIPNELSFHIMNHSLADKRRAPKGKFCIQVEGHTVPATARTEKEWLQFKKDFAKRIIKRWEHFAPNMTWDNVIGYYPNTPYDIAKRLPNMGPEGCWAIIDFIPSQFGRNRPIPELARHRTPIENLYATGSAWHPFANATCMQGYNCYKIIAEDFGLGKPWEKEGRSF